MLFTSRRTIRVSIFILLIIGLVSHMLASRAATGSFADTPRKSASSGDISSVSDLPHSKVNGDKQKQQISETLANLPLRFEQNVGQTNDQSQFFTRNQAYNIGFAARHATISLTSLSDKDDKAQAKTASVQMNFIGSNPATRLSGMEKLETKSNYFTGNNPKNWHTNVANFASLKYQNLYNGIDAIVYGKEQNVEYDFVVAPLADAKVIQLSFEGAKNVSIDEQGDLIVETVAGDMRQHKPFAYQQINGERKEVVCSYRFLQAGSSATNSKLHNQQAIITHSIIAFDIGEYDKNLPLIIDPMIDFSSFLSGGSSLVFSAADVALDADENIYIVGYLVEYPPAGVQAQAVSNQPGVFVAKVDSVNKQLVYLTYLNDPSQKDYFQQRAGIAVDATGNAYVTGSTGYFNVPSTYPTTQGAFQTTLQGTTNGFITKLNPEGNALVYSTFLGAADPSGTGTLPQCSQQSNGCITRISDIAIDAAGNAYVTGETSVRSFPTTPNAYKPTKSNDDCSRPTGTRTDLPCREAFITKLNAAGTALVYSTFLGGNGDDSGTGIKVDSSGNAYVVGTTEAKDFPTQNALNSNFLGGTSDVFLSKLNATGSALLYSTYLGGSGIDRGYALDVDTENNIYLAGETYSMDLPTTAGGFQGKPSNQVIYKTTDSGAIWKPLIKGLSSLYIGQIAIDPNNSVNLLASTNKGIYQSTDAGESWEPTSSNQLASSNFLTFAPQNPSVVFAFSYDSSRARYRLSKSTDKGNTWSEISYPLSENSPGSIGDLQVDPTDLSTLYLTITYFTISDTGQIGNIYSRILKTTDSGATWKNVDQGLPLPANPKLLGINPKNPAVLLANANGLYRSKDGGEKWKPTGLTDASISVVAFDPVNPDVVYAGGNKLYSSTDSGLTWKQIDSNLTNFRQILVTTNSMYAVSSDKVFKSTDGGKTWIDSGSAFDITNVQSLAIDPKNPAILYAGGQRYDNDGFVMKINSQGSAISYCTYLGGKSLDSVSSIAVDNLGIASVTGSTSSDNFPVKDAIQPKSPYGGSFVTKLNTTGMAIYSTYLTGNHDVTATGIATDKNGRVYVVGRTGSDQFPQISPVQPPVIGYISFITRITDAPLAHAAPQVFSITPDTGIGIDQIRATIKGANFLQGATVSVGNSLTRDTVVIDANTIQTTIQGGAGTQANILVMNPDGQTAILEEAFNFLLSPLIQFVNIENDQLVVRLLLVSNPGYGFDSGAVLLVNGKEVKIDPPVTRDTLRSRKALKKIKIGQTAQLQVRNGNGVLSNIGSYRRP